MEENTSPSKSHGHPAVWALGVFVSVYFLFPHLLIWPLDHLGMSPAVKDGVKLLFVPVGYLYDNVPIYRELINQESKWTGVH